MKFCPQCGSELNEGAKFCPSCGFQITARQGVPPPPPPSPAPEPGPGRQAQEPVYGQAKQATNVFTNAVTGKTNLVQRVINILMRPKEEWQVIANERPDKNKILFGYLMILALIPAIITFINYSLIFSYSTIYYPIIQAVISYCITISIIYLASYIVDLLAPSFDSEQNFDRSFQLVSYAYTPVCVVFILGVIPGLNIIAIFVGFLYMIYLLITGIPLLKKAPDDKATGYGILLVLIMLILFFILQSILGKIFFKMLFRGLIYP